MNQDGTAITPSAPSFSGSDDPNQNLAQNPAPVSTPTSTPAPITSTDPSFATRVAAAPGQDKLVIRDTAPADNGSNKKIVIIGGIVALIMIALIGVVMISQQIAGNKDNLSAKQLFNAYADYIVNGGSSSSFELSESYNPDTKYAVKDKINTNNGKGDKEYLAEAYNKLAAFYKKAKDEIKADGMRSVGVYVNKVYLLKVYSEHGTYDAASFDEVAESRSAEAAVNNVEEFYKAYEGNEASADYANDMIEYYSNYGQEIYYIVTYCKDDEENYTGVEYCDDTEYNTVKQYRDKKKEALDSAAQQLQDAKSRILGDLWTVRKVVYDQQQ